MTKSKPKKRITIEFPAEMYEQIVKEAAFQMSTLSWVIRRLIQEGLDK